MATLIENVNAVKAAFSDIKAAIAEKGVEVADGTPVTEYASLIASISGGAENRTKYKYYRLTITDFRRNGEHKRFANLAEVKLYNKNLVNLCLKTEGMVYTANSYSTNSGWSELLPPRNAFDGNTDTYWHSDWENNPQDTNWIKAEFPEAVAVYSLGLVTQNLDNDYPAAFRLEGSNDDNEYTTLVSVSGITEWAMGEEKMYAIE